ncbi:hypothetical protein CC80DRAFT_506419 [Byssothecium circinans]|uniref:Uncharacterized protein n=1 Tax=Byssothecium circinans TaxID=147558 RepID=A0A6A5TRV9_9PLEO|nr:hypothetical protein CC80DRAFT_506419 [Byssothecium circinans]
MRIDISFPYTSTAVKERHRHVCVCVPQQRRCGGGGVYGSSSLPSRSIRSTSGKAATLPRSDPSVMDSQDYGIPQLSLHSLAQAGRSRAGLDWPKGLGAWELPASAAYSYSVEVDRGPWADGPWTDRPGGVRKEEDVCVIFSAPSCACWRGAGAWEMLMLMCRGGRHFPYWDYLGGWPQREIHGDRGDDDDRKGQDGVVVLRTVERVRFPGDIIS